MLLLVRMLVTAGLVCSWDCLVLEQHSGGFSVLGLHALPVRVTLWDSSGYRRHRGDSQGVELDQPILHSQLQNLQPSLILPHKLLLYGRFSTDSLFC
jgi:hypothetical protein